MSCAIACGSFPHQEWLGSSLIAWLVSAGQYKLIMISGKQTSRSLLGPLLVTFLRGLLDYSSKITNNCMPDWSSRYSAFAVHGAERLRQDQLLLSRFRLVAKRFFQWPMPISREHGLISCLCAVCVPVTVFKKSMNYTDYHSKQVKWVNHSLQVFLFLFSFLNWCYKTKG